MLKNAERHRDNPEFQQDMLMTVENSVERMSQLMMQLREGATPVDSPRGVDLADSSRRIQRGEGRAGPRLTLEAGAESGGRDRQGPRRSHRAGDRPSRAERARCHRRRRTVWLRTGARKASRPSSTIGDTGHGMTPEFVRERLFKPFQTTKPAGHGHRRLRELSVRARTRRQDYRSNSDAWMWVRRSIVLPLFEAGSGPVGQRGATHERRKTASRC